MIEQKYITLKTAQELKKRADKAGVELPKSKAQWRDDPDHIYKLELGEFDWDDNNNGQFIDYPAYDILNEICCEHAEFFFGKCNYEAGDYFDEWEYYEDNIFPDNGKKAYEKGIERGDLCIFVDRDYGKDKLLGCIMEYDREPSVSGGAYWHHYYDMRDNVGAFGTENFAPFLKREKTMSYHLLNIFNLQKKKKKKEAEKYLLENLNF